MNRQEIYGIYAFVGVFWHRCFGNKVSNLRNIIIATRYPSVFQKYLIFKALFMRVVFW